MMMRARGLRLRITRNAACASRLRRPGATHFLSRETREIHDKNNAQTAKGASGDCSWAKATTRDRNFLKRGAALFKPVQSLNRRCQVQQHVNGTGISPYFIAASMIIPTVSDSREPLLGISLCTMAIALQRKHGRCKLDANMRIMGGSRRATIDRWDSELTAPLWQRLDDRNIQLSQA
ncbi:hypothetical protein FIBSPDRAFT_898957 [Athelia psychrophila]|uniref:Uncharacterized protein n=1 Tax=Athelia psychrophila TaxID=1759441 RepID=A0A166ADP1_9AGAM|nr:hypothetical protein FIBSPDRAFT_898957 [Fibularhizoctonia sp. CBS 109695]